MRVRFVTALVVALGLSPVLGQAQQAEPKFEIESAQMPPIGQGLPNGKPIDILGIYAGMSGDDALKILTEHYKPQAKLLQLVPETMRLQFAAKPYLAYAGPREVVTTVLGDRLSVAFTSNAAGNQAVNIFRHVHYDTGQEVNTDQTIAAIIAKYGEPSERRQNHFVYAYRNGAVAKDKLDGCVGGLGSIAAERPAGTSAFSWYQNMASAAARNQSTNPNAPGCSAFLSIRFFHPSPNGQTNEKVINALSVGFFDVDRFVAGHNYTIAAQEELAKKAKAAAPKGAGASKL